MTQNNDILDGGDASPKPGLPANGAMQAKAVGSLDANPGGTAQANRNGNLQDILQAGLQAGLQGGEAYIFDIYRRYLQDPSSVASDWQQVFAAMDGVDDANPVSAQSDPSNGNEQYFTNASSYQPSWARKPSNGAAQKDAVIGVHKKFGKSLSDFLLSGMVRGENLQDSLSRYLSDQKVIEGVMGEREVAERLNSIRAIMLIRAFRTRGHLEADLDPLQLSPKINFPELDYRSHGFTEEDLEKTIYINYYLGLESARLKDIIAICRKAYCGRFAIEFMHVQDPDEKLWLQEKVEADYAGKSLTANKQKSIYQQIVHAEMFESFLDKKYQGAKRFGLDGGESTIPVLMEIITRGAELGIEEVDIGMAHRGRLNVLANILGKPYRQIFYEFYGGSVTPDNLPQMGDVKYHIGASHDMVVNTPNGEQRTVHLSLAPNPSHLEAVNTVVLGKVRAKQKQKNDDKKRR